MQRMRILLIAGIVSLNGCGHQVDLEPAPGHRLPVKPLMARSTPTFEQLLTPPIQTRPVRVDELVTRSKPRPADPFDLPPPTGGAAPSGPPGIDPGAVTNNVTSANPGA
ncbi:MAG TPA: hypothetical protein VGU01_10925 [Sphingomicrobium sp.]|nr:hypothetical protein [Sphingomicrobium sp.]